MSGPPDFEYDAGGGVKVVIDPEDMDELGWVHQSVLDAHECVCSMSCCIDGEDPDALYDPLEVIRGLHRQAHPSQHPEPVLCHEERCRSLPIDALRAMPP